MFHSMNDQGVKFSTDFRTIRVIPEASVNLGRKHTFDIVGQFVKERSYRFFKDGLAAELLREMCEMGLICCDFSSMNV